ncbi:MAG: helix-turn-helix transcriptional regulator [Tenacibaculum sp.]|nr:helix-turn-helix transcriptional regulator [Tenacibaculum sp.]
MENFKEFGVRFTNYMTNKKLGVNKMAEKLNFSGSQISNIRNGKVFGTDKLFKILNTYTDIDANWLFRGEKEKSAEMVDNSKYIELLEENRELRKEIERLQRESSIKIEEEKRKRA